MSQINHINEHFSGVCRVNWHRWNRQWTWKGQEIYLPIYNGEYAIDNTLSLPKNGELIGV